MEVGVTSDLKAPGLRYVHEFANGDLDVGSEIFADDFVVRQKNGDMGAERYVEGMRALFRAFPDWRATLLAIAAEGDTLFDRVGISATHSGGSAPTGERFEGVEVVHFWRVRDGKLAELASSPPPSSRACSACLARRRWARSPSSTAA
jgi:ketosteroid isomerase-like protein